MAGHRGPGRRVAARGRGDHPPPRGPGRGGGGGRWRAARSARPPAPRSRPLDEPLRAISEEAARELLAEAGERLGRPSTTEARRGRVEREVVEAAEDMDLLVLARDGDHSRLGPRSLGPPRASWWTTRPAGSSSCGPTRRPRWRRSRRRHRPGEHDAPPPALSGQRHNVPGTTRPRRSGASNISRVWPAGSAAARVVAAARARVARARALHHASALGARRAEVQALQGGRE